MENPCLWIGDIIGFALVSWVGQLGSPPLNKPKKKIKKKKKQNKTKNKNKKINKKI